MVYSSCDTGVGERKLMVILMHYKNPIRLSLLSLILGLSVFALGYRQANHNSIHLKNLQMDTSGVSSSDPNVGFGIVSYPYGSQRFTRFIEESYAHANQSNPDEFYRWMDKAYDNTKFRYPGKESLDLNSLLSAEKQELDAISDPAKKTYAEIQLGAWVHRYIKTVIPKFSLDRGFEFTNTVALGERQCFLQSVLIAGLLQDMGVNAGVVMVYKNLEGQETNNGHAVTLVKLPDGHDIIVDASEPEPFARQRGLFVRVGDYRYVDPIYEKDSSKIGSYTLAGSRGRVSPSSVSTLDYDFLRSQFWYYRGERTSGGIISASKTRTGLQESERHLLTSVKICSQNPLSVYMLGRTYYAEGKKTLSRKSIGDAYRLYSRFGWVPQGEIEYLALTDGGVNH